MRIFITGNEEQENEIRQRAFSNDHNFIFSRQLPYGSDYDHHDVFFILDKTNEINFEHFKEKPVVINSVTDTLHQMGSPKNVSRINGWSGFLQRPIWEVVSEGRAATTGLFSSLGIEIIFVKDEPGLVTARVISMIINEAFYALNENVSTKKEIDLAMKLGTNYPYGPFEWAEKIGLGNVHNLLNTLAANDDRYIPAFSIDN